MTDTPIERLKGCPFCGAPAEHKDFGRGRACVQCCNVECRAHSMLSLAGEDAVAAWNTRATIEPIPSAGEGERRVCSICTATVFSYPEGMCCHCQEMPWPLAPLPSEPPSGRVEIKVGDPDYEKFNLRTSEECKERLARKPSAARVDCVMGTPSEPLRDD